MSFTRIPSLNWLRVFEAAAKTESFAQAADLLGMSPPAVSQQIKSLESYLGKPLFERGPRSVTLTDAGRAFLPAVQQSFQSVETTAAALFGRSSHEGLTVQASLILACSWLSCRVAKFREAHPEVQLQLMTGNRVDEFRRSDADLRIVFGSGPEVGEEGDRLFGEWLYPVATPEIAAGIQSLQDLLKHRLIEITTHRTGWFQVLQAIGRSDEASIPNPGGGNANRVDMAAADICFADTTQLSLALAAEGYGIALARAPATDRLAHLYGLSPCVTPDRPGFAGVTRKTPIPQGMDLPPFAIEGTRAYYLTYPSLSSLRPASRKFRDWLLSEARKQSTSIEA